MGKRVHLYIKLSGKDFGGLFTAGFKCAMATLATSFFLLDTRKSLAVLWMVFKSRTGF